MAQLTTADGSWGAPQDLHDWVRLTTRIDGIYQLPSKLLEAGGPLPELGTAPWTTGPGPAARPKAWWKAIPCATPCGSWAATSTAEGLLRAGYPAARNDGPAVFSFLCRPRTGLGGRIGPLESWQLRVVNGEGKQRLGIVEEVNETPGALIEKHESLEMAFSDMDSAAEGALTRESLAQGIEERPDGAWHGDVESMCF
eukprot:Skav234948  [mRNA]  locus=scaffold2817:92405:96505:- [translate_table: standard]